MRVGVPTGVRTGHHLCPHAVPYSKVLKKDKIDNIRAAEAQLPQPEIFVDEKMDCSNSHIFKRPMSFASKSIGFWVEKHRFLKTNKYGRKMVEEFRIRPSYIFLTQSIIILVRYWQSYVQNRTEMSENGQGKIRLVLKIKEIGFWHGFCNNLWRGE